MAHMPHWNTLYTLRGCRQTIYNALLKGTVSQESLQKYKSAKTHLQQWQATASGAFS